MALNIEDYALIADGHTAALVGRDGSIDWLCLPRFDSPSTFAALLGGPDQGRWLVAPEDSRAVATRRYVENTFVLVTTWSTPDGVVTVTDLMPHGTGRPRIIRRIEGISGTVTLSQEVRIRFGYATAIPWIRQVADSSGRALVAIAGPDALVFRGPGVKAINHSHRGDIVVHAGRRIDLELTWFPSHRPIPEPLDVDTAFTSTIDWWQDWARSCQHEGPYFEQVNRSLLVLKALTHEDTGGIVAAPTTSLPEELGGVRNWDYRFVWLRDAALTLQALMAHGFATEAQAWRQWLLRAIAGDPQDVQIMYGVAGERSLPEREIPSLPGYLGATPVRIGNGAVSQFQGDVLGEVMIALHAAREAGIDESAFSWPLQRALMSYLERNWRRADQGIWEIRGPARQFTHSLAMRWAALDRAVRGVTEFGLPGNATKWAGLRDHIREVIESQCVDVEQGGYTQYPGTREVDASLLQLPQIGYCAWDSPRMLATVASIESDLMDGGLLRRYRTETGVDGLTPGEHPFLACSFWLVEQYAHTDRLAEAIALMDRLVGFCSDVGLLSEEVDPATGHHLGNTPQAFSHLALVRAADAIALAQTTLALALPNRDGTEDA